MPSLGSSRPTEDHYRNVRQQILTAAFVQRLRELGWIEGRTVAIDYRWAEGRSERTADFATEFVHLKVDVIVTQSTPAVLAAKQVTSVIPIVFGSAGDPVGTGVVANLARLRRGQVLAFFSRIPRCLVGLEACATRHYWARELGALGHEVRLMPAQYVKAYIKRNKNDAADAEAICEAVGRPTMRFVPVKTTEQQSVSCCIVAASSWCVSARC